MDKEMKEKKQDNNKEPNVDITSLEPEIKVLMDEAVLKDDHSDKYMRLQAEFDNYKKRSIKEKGEFVKFANEFLIMELVSILDDFNRSIKYAEANKDFNLLHQGVDMISRQLMRLLEEKGLNRIECLGKRFNPHEHEAIEVIEDEKVEEDLVVEELQPGYRLNGRIIRPAKVKVAKPKAKE